MQEIIIEYYPFVLKQIKEIQQIARAEDIEFEKIRGSLNQVGRNMFISTSDESGVKRFERVFGITPKKGQTLEDRKLYLRSRENRGKLSLDGLIALFAEYGQEIRLLNHMFDFEIEIIRNKDVISLEMIYQIADEVLPLNIYFEVLRELYAELHTSIGMTTQVCINVGWEE